MAPGHTLGIQYKGLLGNPMPLVWMADTIASAPATATETHHDGASDLDVHIAMRRAAAERARRWRLDNPEKWALSRKSYVQEAAQELLVGGEARARSPCPAVTCPTARPQTPRPLRLQQHHRQPSALHEPDARYETRQIARY